MSKIRTVLHEDDEANLIDWDCLEAIDTNQVVTNSPTKAGIKNYFRLPKKRQLSVKLGFGGTTLYLEFYDLSGNEVATFELMEIPRAQQNNWKRDNKKNLDITI